MLKDADAKTLNFMVTATCFSPLLYGLIAVMLDGKPGTPSPYLLITYRTLIIFSFVLLVASRPFESFLIPRGAKKGDVEDAKLALAGILLAGVSELIALLGVAAVIAGASAKDFVPFFLISALSFADFRIFRFPTILELMQNDGTSNPDE